MSDATQRASLKQQANAVRTAIMSAYALADMANKNAALERIKVLGEVFTGNAAEAVADALSLTKARDAGILPKTTQYNRLSESKAFYSCFKAGQWDQVSGETVSLVVENDDGTMETLQGSDWSLRYKVARTLNKERNEREREARELEAALPYALAAAGGGADKETIAKQMKQVRENAIAKEEAERKTPTATAKRFIASAWTDKGSAWCIAYSAALAAEIVRMVEEGTKGAVNQINTANKEIQPGENAAEILAEAAASIAPDVTILQDAKEATAKARKAAAAAKYRTAAAEPAQATG